MSLCLAREGNFCAKLTWCPLAGRWRLVSGSDLHTSLYITLPSHLAQPQSAWQPGRGNWELRLTES